VEWGALAKEDVGDGTECSKSFQENVWVCWDMARGSAIAAKNILYTNIGCLCCCFFQINKCSCLCFGEALKCKWCYAMVDIVQSVCIEEFVHLKVLHKIWLDGVLNMHVDALGIL